MATVNGGTAIFLLLTIFATVPYCRGQLLADNGSSPCSQGAVFEDMLGCVTDWQPCSFSIPGNLILVVLYGLVLGGSAKLISDGAELLLELGLPAAIIGGVVLPLLGAVPDSAMIVASGVGGSRADAQKEINVGMGTLAGSTIMLLTLPWLGSIILGRVDIVRKEGIDGQRSKFTIKSFWHQGVSVFPDVTRSAIVMLITILPYFIVQGADWYYGPTRPNPANGTSFPTDANGTLVDPPDYVKYTSLATSLAAFIFFVLYLVYQILDSVSAKRQAEEKRKELMKRRVVRQLILLQKRTMERISVQDTPAIGEAPTEKKALLGGPSASPALEKKYFGAWRASKGLAKAAAEKKKEEEAEPPKEEKDNGKEEDEPKWKIALKSFLQLFLGVGFVTLFSDPMAGALTAITDPLRGPPCGSYIPIPTFYVSFVVTPLCSNASEIISSLMFASKMKKVNTSMTFSQIMRCSFVRISMCVAGTVGTVLIRELYGAATMNNTLCLGIFAILIFGRGLYWEYSAEVTVIILIEVAVGIIAISSGFLYKHTYVLLLGVIVGCLYFVSIALIAALEFGAKWK